MKQSILTLKAWLAICLALLPLLLATPASGAGVPVSVNMPVTVVEQVRVGMTHIDIPIAVSGATLMRIDVIVPVDNATIELLDPDGQNRLGPRGSALEFVSGEEIRPGLPGGIFIVESVPEPKDGLWQIRLAFSPASHPTVVVATAMLETQYRAGLTLARDRYLVGEDIGIGLLVLDNGNPVAGLTPEIRVEAIDFFGTTTVQTAVDDGVGADGLSGDGIFSVDVALPVAGRYRIEGRVEIPSSSGPVLRTAVREIVVTQPTFVVRNLATRRITSGLGCIEAFEAVFDVDVLEAADLSISASLKGSNGREWVQRKFLPGQTVGSRQYTLRFPASALRSEIGVDGPYFISNVKVFRVQDELELQYENASAGITSAVRLDDLCREAVEIEPSLRTEPVLRNGMIEALDLGFPVNVSRAGTYSISTKILGRLGEEVALVSVNRPLNVGANEVVIRVPAERFLKADGPYSVLSVLVLGPAGSGSRSRIGETPAFSRWQFLPSLRGDLNADGQVDATDRDLLLNYRGTPALVPGDRRDLNADQKIDVRDTRAILKLLGTQRSPARIQAQPITKTDAEKAGQ